MNTRTIAINRHRTELFEQTVTLLAAIGLRALKYSQQHVASLVALVDQWLQRGRDRALLREMGEHLLRDIGLTRVDVLVEADKPFWRA